MGPYALCAAARKRCTWAVSQVCISRAGARGALTDSATLRATKPSSTAISNACLRRRWQSSTVRLPQPVAHAWDDRGHDVTALLHTRDHRYAAGFELLPFKGFTRMHSLEVDLGESYRAGPLRQCPPPRHGVDQRVAGNELVVGCEALDLGLQCRRGDREDRARLGRRLGRDVVVADRKEGHGGDDRQACPTSSPSGSAAPSSATARSSPSPASTSTCRSARASGCSGRTAPGSRPRCGS